MALALALYQEGLKVLVDTIKGNFTLYIFKTKLLITKLLSVKLLYCMYRNEGPGPEKYIFYASALNFNPNVFCDPLGDRNIYWPMGLMSDDVKNVIMVIARIDVNSLYENLVPGAGSTATGLVILLATATYLDAMVTSVNATLKGQYHSKC